MQSAVVIDLQPLNCVGMQACLQHLFPDIQCLLVSSERSLDTLASNAQVGLVMLGLNQEHNALLAHLKEKALAVASGAPVIICYQNFDLEYIKNFGRLAGIGLVCKDHIQEELAQCIQKVTLGQTYVCDDTGQYLISTFVKLSKPKRIKKVQGAG